MYKNTASIIIYKIMQPFNNSEVLSGHMASCSVQKVGGTSAGRVTEQDTCTIPTEVDGSAAGDAKTGSAFIDAVLVLIPDLDVPR